MLPGRKYTPLDFAAMAWRRSWLIVGGLVLGAYAALVVSSQLQDTFQSEMLIQVIPQRVPDTYVQSTVTMRTEERLNALSQQVLSRTALEALINEMNLYSERRAASADAGRRQPDAAGRARGSGRVDVDRTAKPTHSTCGSRIPIATSRRK